MKIYGKTVSYMVYDENMNWRWIDEENGIVWCVTVPVDDRMDLEVVRTIVDLNY